MDAPTGVLGDAPAWSLERLLGGVPLDEIAGGPVDPGSVTVTPEQYAFGSPATGGLFRVRGRRPDGAPWSSFVKVLQHVRHWPFLRFMPPPAAALFTEMFPWREELSMWRPAFVDRLPAGLRVPELYRVVELGDDRVTVWAEEIIAAGSVETVWDEARFAQAATLLGAFNARMCDAEVLAGCPFEPDYGLRMWVEHALPEQGFRPLTDDGLWAHPALRGAGDVREGLRALAPRVGWVMQRLAELRHGMPHGDASPQNLLGPDAAGDLVAIDISFQTPAPLGTDLAQLVVGLGHAGLLPPQRLRAVEEAVLPAYAAGVGTVGLPPGRDDLEFTYAGTLLLRSGFTAVPYRELDDADPATVTQRLGLTRFILDVAARHLGA